MCTMAYDDDGYVLDTDGNRILIGLTDDNRSLNERRWHVRYDKHEAAVRTYLSA